MNERKINWYRSPVKREAQVELNQRDDWKGLAQTLGHLGLLALTGICAAYAAGRLPIWVLLIILYIHGTFYAFLSNGFHELCHKTVFRSKRLGVFFLYLVSFLSWYNPIFFWASHQEHHKYTLNPPDDLEEVLPVPMTAGLFLQAAFINPWDFIGRLKNYIRLSFGRLEGEWENALFPASATVLRKNLFNWTRFHLIGHALIAVVSLYFGLWMIPVLITLAPFYGGALYFLINNTQHIGLQDNVSDYRLCCRTIILNPFISFVYWRMNYHTEHHMYAAVPCYNLEKLHEQIKSDLPDCPVGLIQTWKEIIAILRLQKVDPTYQHVAQLPKKI